MNLLNIFSILRVSIFVSVPFIHKNEYSIDQSVLWKKTYKHFYVVRVR